MPNPVDPNAGMLGKAASAISGRQRQLDAQIDAQVSGVSSQPQQTAPTMSQADFTNGPAGTPKQQMTPAQRNQLAALLRKQ